jgi:hypothetical protein
MINSFYGFFKVSQKVEETWESQDGDDKKIQRIIYENWKWKDGGKKQR